MLGGGLWCPPPEQLSRLRRDIDRKPHRIKSVLNGAGIRKEFFDGIPEDEKKAVHAFVNHSENASNALKSKPKVSFHSLSYVSTDHRSPEVRERKRTTSPPGISRRTLSRHGCQASSEECRQGNLERPVHRWVLGRRRKAGTC